MIVLDTHVLIWWLDKPNKISPKILERIEEARLKHSLYVSTISVWEICLLEKKKRLSFDLEFGPWLEKLENLSFMQFVPIDNTIAKLSISLGDKFHADPADRFIVATTLSLGATLITTDKKILAYKKVRTAW